MQISPQLWTMWPLLYQAFNEWAFDYFENILVPLDNFISRGTAVFLSSQNPNYLNQVTLQNLTNQKIADTSFEIVVARG